MDSFIRGWAPVSKWPRMSTSQLPTRRSFEIWHRHFEARDSAVRGPNISRERILHLSKQKKVAFSDDYPPDEWTPEMLVARLLHRLYRLHKLHLKGVFYGRALDDDRALDAFFDSFLEVKKNASDSKSRKLAIIGAILPLVKSRNDSPQEAPKADDDAGHPVRSTQPEHVEMMELDPVVAQDAEETQQIFRRDDHERYKTHEAHVSLVLKAYEFDDEDQKLFDTLEDYLPTDTRLDLLVYPACGQRGSAEEACRILSIEQKQPFYLDDTPVPQVLEKHQVQGIAFIHKHLKLFQKVALFDDMGFGKTRQTLLGLERALRTTTDASKPSLIIVPSGVVGEQWLKEGLATTNTLSFVSVGGGFGGAHKFHRVRYLKRSEFEEIDPITDRYTIVVFTYDTFRKLVEEHCSIDKEFYAVAVDEMQIIRKLKQSQTFRAVDQLQPNWHISVTATPLMNGPSDIKGCLGVFRNKDLDAQTVRKAFDQHGNPFDHGSKAAFYMRLPEAWERFIDGSDFHVQADALTKVASKIPFIIRRDSETRDEKGERVGPAFPPLLISRQSVTFSSEGAKKAYVKRFNKVLDELATMTLSPFAVKIPAEQAVVARFNVEGATLAQICRDVLRKPVSDQQALEKVRSPKLEWLSAFLASVVVKRREKVLLFVLNNREQLLVRAFIEALGIPTANYHSKLTAAERELMIQAFNSDGGPPVFISTWEMGSVGFNTQQKCCIVVALSLYYNQNAERQRRTRIHRPCEKRLVLYI
ncbi:P-loop containing nucleoside triphosphate hydrolase protein [Phyllosticta capitalensis]